MCKEGARNGKGERWDFYGRCEAQVELGRVFEGESLASDGEEEKKVKEMLDVGLV